MAGDGPVIVKRIKKGGHGAHHGGAWKVAYADFVTAMMAFFLLMWLINTTTPEQKRGIADYFAAQSISQTSSGSGGVLGGKVLGAGRRARRRRGVGRTRKQRRPRPPIQRTPRTSANHGGGATDAQGKSPHRRRRATSIWNARLPSSQDGDFAQAAESIRQAMQEMPDIAALSRQVIDRSDAGRPAHPARRSGWPPDVPAGHRRTDALHEANCSQRSRKIIDRLPNRISISGHTDAQPSRAGRRDQLGTFGGARQCRARAS